MDLLRARGGFRSTLALMSNSSVSWAVAWPHVLAGLGLGLGLIVAIGAQNAHVLRMGLLRQHVGLTVLVCLLSDAVLIAAGIAGVGALVSEHAQLLRAIKYAGALFLLWYGYKAFARARQAAQLQVAAEPLRLSMASAASTVLALTLLNPHVYLDTVVLLGGISAQRPPEMRWFFGAGAITASTLWFVGLGYGAKWLAPLFAKPRAWMWLDLGVGCTMVGIALALVLG
jgi:L-lysine exporter family protein LysE/ArgO